VGAGRDCRIEKSFPGGHAAQGAGQGPCGCARNHHPHRARRREAHVRIWMMAGRTRRLVTAAFVAGGALGTLAAVLVQGLASEAAPAPRREARANPVPALMAPFRRPATVPFPADNPFSEKKRALGEA